MSYIGNTATQQAFTPAVDFFNGNGSTTAFTLSRPVASVAQVQAVISNVPQKPGDAFTVSGNTITFTSAPPSGTQNIYVYYTSPITQVIAPGQGTVGTAQIQEGAVITADIADLAVTAAKINSKTGTGAVALASLPSFTTTIGVGGATASASGSGISFPATQSASSDANTLDDYEEGTFTPVFTASSGSPTTNYSLGTYVKIGRLVQVTVFASLAKNTASSYMTITGLPFVVETGYYPQACVMTDLCASQYSNPIIQFASNSSSCYPITGNGGTASHDQGQWSLWGAATFSFRFTATYRTP